MPRHPLDTDFCYHHHRQIRWILLHYHFGDHLGPVRILYLADLKECEGGKERREKRRKEQKGRREQKRREEKRKGKEKKRKKDNVINIAVNKGKHL